MNRSGFLKRLGLIGIGSVITRIPIPKEDTPVINKEVTWNTAISKPKAIYSRHCISSCMFPTDTTTLAFYNNTDL